MPTQPDVEIYDILSIICQFFRLNMNNNVSYKTNYEVLLFGWELLNNERMTGGAE